MTCENVAEILASVAVSLIVLVLGKRRFESLLKRLQTWVSGYLPRSSEKDEKSDQGSDE